MTFISYAQNQEDVFLFRAFKHLSTGFYVDVGANDPVKDSVTQAFYERRWRGINIDPVPYWHQRLENNRKHDINLAIAVSDRAGQFEFFELPETGLSTLNPEQAESYHQQGQTVRRVTVQTRTLAEVLEDYPLPEIHFLKIDVEGAEASVIRGADWQKHRPWVILIESTLPNTNTSVHEDWEPVLLANQYHFVWFDGINRFYVADERSELDAAFRVPVNVLDQFVPIDTFNLRTGARELQLQLLDLQPLRLKLLEREIEIHDLNDGIAKTRLAYEQAQAVANRLPCRVVRGFFKLPLILIRKLKASLIATLKKTILGLYGWLQRRPALLGRMVRLLQLNPRLARRVRAFAGLPGQLPQPVDAALPNISSLAPDEFKAYRQITDS